MSTRSFCFSPKYLLKEPNFDVTFDVTFDVKVPLAGTLVLFLPVATESELAARGLASAAVGLVTTALALGLGLGLAPAAPDLPAILGPGLAFAVAGLVLALEALGLVSAVLALGLELGLASAALDLPATGLAFAVAGLVLALEALGLVSAALALGPVVRGLLVVANSIAIDLNAMLGGGGGAIAVHSSLLIVPRVMGPIAEEGH